MLITKGLKIIYKNELGRELELSFFSPYICEKAEEELKNNITTSKQNLIHGNTFISSTLENRYITLSGYIERRFDVEERRREMIKVFNPNIKGILNVITDKTHRKISVLVEEVPSIERNGGLIRFEINLVATTPFWEEKKKIEHLALLSGRLKFPLGIPKNKGMIFGSRRSILQSEINNIGDVESGFTVKFKATGGVVKNPKIYNMRTNEYIKINITLEKGDILEVLNYPDIKKITVNSIKNCFKYLDIGSDFFNLKIGENKVGYIADENTINLDVIVYYTPRYLGV